jgi:hypothetical protein
MRYFPRDDVCIQPITAAARVGVGRGGSKTVIMNSNATRGIDYVHVFMRFAVLRR